MAEGTPSPSWEQIRDRVRSDVKSHAMARKDPDPHVSFTGMAHGFLCGTEGLPSVHVQVDFAKREVRYVNSSEAGQTEEIVAEIVLEPGGSCLIGERRFDTIEELSRALLAPLLECDVGSARRLLGAA